MVAIRLFHGRKDPKQNMDDWGDDGPVLGPFTGIHGTYMSHLRGVIEGESEGDFNFIGDMIYYDGIFYGDYVIMDWELAKKEHPREIEEYDPAKSEMTEEAKELSKTVTLIDPQHYRESVHHFMYFLFNFNYNFMDAFKEEKWLVDHLNPKWRELYTRYGPTEAMARFFMELDHGRRNQFMDWVMENYTGYTMKKQGNDREA